MIRVYDLDKNPRFGEVLTCRCFMPGDSIERLRFTFRFDSKQSEPFEICCFRDPCITCGVLQQELNYLLGFVESPHWRDFVAKQWERYGALLEDSKED